MIKLANLPSSTFKFGNSSVSSVETQKHNLGTVDWSKNNFHHA